MTQSPYDVLGIKPSEEGTLKSRYVELVKIWHPDIIAAQCEREGVSAEETEEKVKAATEKCQEIVAAYEAILKSQTEHLLNTSKENDDPQALYTQVKEAFAFFSDCYDMDFFTLAARLATKRGFNVIDRQFSQFVAESQLSKEQFADRLQKCLVKMDTVSEKVFSQDIKFADQFFKLYDEIEGRLEGLFPPPFAATMVGNAPPLLEIQQKAREFSWPVHHSLACDAAISNPYSSFTKYGVPQHQHHLLELYGLQEAAKLQKDYAIARYAQLNKETEAEKTEIGLRKGMMRIGRMDEWRQLAELALKFLSERTLPSAEKILSEMITNRDKATHNDFTAMAQTLVEKITHNVQQAAKDRRPIVESLNKKIVEITNSKKPLTLTHPDRKYDEFYAELIEEKEEGVRTLAVKRKGEKYSPAYVTLTLNPSELAQNARSENPEAHAFTVKWRMPTGANTVEMAAHRYTVQEAGIHFGAEQTLKVSTKPSGVGQLE